MSDRPIVGEDARLYIKYVAGHGLHQDIRWLLDVGRFPVGACVLDIGCGTGRLVAALTSEVQFARSVVGVELSPELASYASHIVEGTGGTIVQGDILSWKPLAGWKADTVVMSYFLHHCEDVCQHLRNAAALLPRGGRLYVLDRVAFNQLSLDAFPKFWQEHYRAAHEWSEDMPRLLTTCGLIEAAKEAGFTFVRRQICPHDRLAGAEQFPKTLMEFWKQEAGSTFPAIMVVSPAHKLAVDEIIQYLAADGLQVSRRMAVPYSDDFIRSIYARCPWREALIRFVGDACSDRIATALSITGDFSTPDRLYRLGQFKKDHRDRWKHIDGPVGTDGFRPIILPFHVPEPYESEILAHLVDLLA